MDSQCEQNILKRDINNIKTNISQTIFDKRFHIYVLWCAIQHSINLIPHPLIVCLFICLFGGNRPTLQFFTHMGTSLLSVKVCNFLPVLGTHGHWAVGFFSVLHLLWHGDSVYNGHLRGPVTFTPIAQRLAVELSLHVFMT